MPLIAWSRREATESGIPVLLSDAEEMRLLERRRAFVAPPQELEKIARGVLEIDRLAERPFLGMVDRPFEADAVALECRDGLVEARPRHAEAGTKALEPAMLALRRARQRFFGERHEEHIILEYVGFVYRAAAHRILGVEAHGRSFVGAEDLAVEALGLEQIVDIDHAVADAVHLGHHATSRTDLSDATASRAPGSAGTSWSGEKPRRTTTRSVSTSISPAWSRLKGCSRKGGRSMTTDAESPVRPNTAPCFMQ